MILNTREAIVNTSSKLQEHRGADEGFRNKPENISRLCENITRMRYKWTMDNGPINSTPSRKHWMTPWSLRRKFLSVNVRFTTDGRRINIV